ncbi:MAG: hypothetical protein CVV42_02020 [Candidatus Riflebacteria bacterium HGW-Riflebacteria-2]|jgi:chromosome segregation ATPase|nr:MAG: hypothetical protein CVV42_02020 [Candidatus Riflebacteria bacterium HGW-Riflebacteria-2]
MKRIGLLLLLMTFVFSLSPGFAQNGSSIVRFGDLHGEVNVRPNDEDDDAYIFAELSTPLNHNDRIKTLTRSGAILSFSDMSTFVMKEDTTIVLDIANERESKIGLVAGNVWVNLKKMVADGSMEVEMSQAVAGIKGTNITCSSDPDAQEDRVKVLRGHASVRIRKTNEVFIVAEGEEIVITPKSAPEKQKIDVEEVQKTWEEDLSGLGESLDIDDLPEMLKNINESSAAEFGRLNETFQALMAMEKVELADAVALRTSAERFVGVILENILVINNARRRVDAAMGTEGITDEQRAQLSSLIREMSASLTGQQNYQAELARMMRYQFRTSAISEEFQSEIEMIRTELAQAIGELDNFNSESSQVSTDLGQMTEELATIIERIDAVRAELANSSGQSQEWFLEKSQELDECSQSIEELSIKAESLNSPINERVQRLTVIGSAISDLSQQTLAIIELSADNAEAQALLKSINEQQAHQQSFLKTNDDLLAQIQSFLKAVSTQQTALASLQKPVAVVEIDTATITEMQQIEFEISEAIVTLEQGVRDYNSISVSPLSAAISRSTIEEQEARLRASIAIMSSFNNARRLYQKAQRKYDATMRSTTGSGVRTGEQEEMDSLWMNISDRFQQLGVVAEELQQHIQELEDNLNHMLNQ